MSTVTVVAKLVVKEAGIYPVKSELLKLITPTRQEEGCLEYRLHQDSEDPCVFIFYENWQNAVCLERHMNSAHFKSYVAAVGGLLAEKVVHKLTEIG